MKILVLGAGGAASNGFARALKLAGGYELIGANCNPTDLLLSECDTNHLVAHSNDFDRWKVDVMHIVMRDQPAFVHAQNDNEVEALARIRTMVHGAGTKTYLPSLDAIRLCRDKWESYKVWSQAKLPVPQTALVRGRESLHYMTEARRAEAWLRPRIGAGGQKGLKTGSLDTARAWMNHHKGWGEFTAAEVLTQRTVTVQTLWWKGEVVCSQQRTRESWANSQGTTTGVSGSTGVGVTSSESAADDVAFKAVQAVDAKPHGLYGVDMAYNDAGVPCLTEINVGRFFTTASEFYARAGFNMAHAYALVGRTQGTGDFRCPTINPIPDGFKWVRAMDREPLLVSP